MEDDSAAVTHTEHRTAPQTAVELPVNWDIIKVCVCVGNRPFLCSVGALLFPCTSCLFYCQVLHIYSILLIYLDYGWVII